MDYKPFENISKDDGALEFYDDAGAHVVAFKRRNYYDVYIKKDGVGLAHDGFAYVKGEDCKRIYRAYLDQKEIDSFFGGTC